MFAFARKKLDLPTAAEALPGRDARMPVPARHFVNGHPLAAPFPAGMQQAIFGLGCFWGAERKFWQTAGRLFHRGRLCRRRDAEPDL